MKYLSEYRDYELIQPILERLHDITTETWHIMEVCGGQTHSLVKNGILELLPNRIQMIHGPGCPVCVTPIELIDQATILAKKPEVILCSFGDMLRVPGSEQSLLQAKAEGADVRMVYSPLDAVRIAQDNPQRQVVFFAVGFETTAPANALSVIQAQKMSVTNYSLLTSHVLVPPAIEAILSDQENVVHGFLAAGHVCTIMGYDEYFPIVEKYKVPIVITGFEPVDLLQGIYMVIDQLEQGVAKLDNQYARAVRIQGNRMARETIAQVFKVKGRDWRGLGLIPDSGFELRLDYKDHDARYKFDLKKKTKQTSNTCKAGEVLKGKIKPLECPHFGKDCTPENPLGAPMVSSEGACAAYYHYYGAQAENSLS